MTIAAGLAEKVGAAPACRALAIPRATFYRWQRSSAKPEDTARERPIPARALTPAERQAVLDTLHEERFWDASPRQVWATLLDEGIYYCSVRTIYRILEEAGENKERREQLTHPAYTKPELLSISANQVWSWDITKLKGPVKWTYFYLYVILDIFSRYVVGWMVAQREGATLAKRLIKDTCIKQNIDECQLILHADRGSSMRSKTVALLLADLGVTKTHSRPYTSTDNPYSEAQFKTMKYRPEFPNRFGCIEDARSFCRDFFRWYNTCQYHSGIGYLTPEMVHYGQAKEVIEARQGVLLDAFAAHPERFVNSVPQPPALPLAVWINKPKDAQDNLVTVGKEVVAP